MCSAFYLAYNMKQMEITVIGAKVHLPAPDAAVAQLQLHNLRVHGLLRGWHSVYY